MVLLNHELINNEYPKKYIIGEQKRYVALTISSKNNPRLANSTKKVNTLNTNLELWINSDEFSIGALIKPISNLNKEIDESVVISPKNTEKRP
mgnify:CR=1 FL=1